MAEVETLTKFLVIWLICMVIFLIIDLVWLSMIAKPFYQRSIGHLMADEIMGEKQDLLDPFRMSRFETGDLHPVSNSPYPWS